MNWPDSLQWREPLWLLLVLVPFAIRLVVFLLKSKTEQGYADPELLPWVIARTSKHRKGRYVTSALRILAWMMFSIALAGPRMAAETIYLNENATPSIVFAVDVSDSMSVKDVFPSRFELARLYINAYMQQQPGIRYGIVLFAGKAHVLIPPTRDTRSVSSAVNALKLPILPSSGSDINAALYLSLDMLAKEPSTNRTLIVVSDGGDIPAEPDTFSASLRDKIQQSHVRIDTWGTGTSEGDVIYTRAGWAGSSRDKTVISRLNRQYLAALASLGNGQYYQVTADLKHLTEIGAGRDGTTASATTGNPSRLIIWHEYQRYFLFIGILLLAALQIDLGKLSAGQARIASVLTSICLLFFIINAHAVSDKLSAWLSYSNGDYRTAINRYTYIKGYDGLLGLGSAQYRLNNYPLARQIYTQAVLAASTTSQRADAIFNLANCLFKQGDYQTAGKLYDDVLRYRPSDKPASINHALAVELSKRVENRRNESLRRRAGRGPRGARPDTKMDLTDTRVSIVNDEDVKTGKTHAATNNTIDLNTLIERGIRHSKLVDNRLVLTQDTDWQYSGLTGESLNLYLHKEAAPDDLLWKRIFEIEEGYPAPLDEPVPVKGVKPW